MKNRQLYSTLFLFFTSIALLVSSCKDEDEASAPTVSITAPAEGASLAEGTSVQIAADAGDADGTVSKVEFYADATLLYTDSTAPYSFAWTASPIGNIALTAKAYDNDGHSTVSAPVHVSVSVNTSIIGSWKTIAATFNPPVVINGSTVTDAYPQLFPNVCDQDDLFIFEAGGIFKDDQGAVKCDTAAAQYALGTYTESGNTFTIIVDGDTNVFQNVTISTYTLLGSVAVDVGTNVEFEMTRQ